MEGKKTNQQTRMDLQIASSTYDVFNKYGLHITPVSQLNNFHQFDILLAKQFQSCTTIEQLHLELQQIINEPIPELKPLPKPK